MIESTSAVAGGTLDSLLNVDSVDQVDRVIESTGYITNNIIVQYDNMVSSGTNNKATGVTSLTITVSEKVVGYSFLYKDTANPNSYCKITNNRMGGADYLADGDNVCSDLKIAETVTFYVSDMTTSATIQYHIDTIETKP